jgi:hypothetical protein
MKSPHPEIQDMDFLDAQASPIGQRLTEKNDTVLDGDRWLAFEEDQVLSHQETIVRRASDEATAAANNAERKVNFVVLSATSRTSHTTHGGRLTWL